MDMKNVNSSNLKAVGHDPETNTLVVRFYSGSLYHYHNVPASEHAALLAAESIGSHFHKHIKSNFSFTLQEDPTKLERTHVG